MLLTNVRRREMGLCLKLHTKVVPAMHSIYFTQVCRLFQNTIYTNVYSDCMDHMDHYASPLFVHVLTTAKYKKKHLSDMQINMFYLLSNVILPIIS